MRKPTVKAFIDVSGWAKPGDLFHAYDLETDTWGFNAAWQVIGHGSTPEEALANYDEELENYDRSLEYMP